MGNLTSAKIAAIACQFLPLVTDLPPSNRRSPSTESDPPNRGVFVPSLVKNHTFSEREYQCRSLRGFCRLGCGDGSLSVNRTDSASVPVLLKQFQAAPKAGVGSEWELVTDGEGLPAEFAVHNRVRESKDMLLGRVEAG